jgi:hypothetical protein
MDRIKVFGIGFHKTGTKTLAACMRALGYRHMSLNRQAFLQYKMGELCAVFDTIRQHDSFDDWPWPLLYQELWHQFPGSKFVLTTRINEFRWFESLSLHVRQRGSAPNGFNFRSYIYGYDNPDQNPAHHIATYLAHNQAVRSFFSDKPGALLEVCWECGDGWQQLCDFLGVGVPALPFPHENSAFAG